MELQCAYQGALVKIESQWNEKRPLGEADILSLCPKAQEVFQASCKARIVSYAQLYGGKLAAALSRQHPRDLFDFWLMRKRELGAGQTRFAPELCGSDNHY